jgi:uncharacterized protein (TIGR00369 family)
MSLVAQLEQALQTLVAPCVQRLQLRVVEASAEAIVLALPVTAEVVHSGGVLCGQAVMAAADTAMVLALTASLGKFQPMTTVQLQTSFLRPVPADTPEVLLRCHVLRRGKSLAFGDIQVTTPDGRLAAHATTTYALL